MRKINRGQPTYLKIQNKGHKKDVITTVYNKQYFHVMFKPIRGEKERRQKRCSGEVKNKRGGLSSHPVLI